MIPDPNTHLMRYLPGAVNELLPDALRAHLAAVLRAVKTYVPRYVIEHGSQAAFDVETLLFADISGFTAMSERLSQLGREGAEVITGIVNDYFDTMLGLLAQYGGDLYKFGGDALLAAFRDDEGPGGSSLAAQRACAAACAMQQAMQRFEQLNTPQGVFTLRMKIGLSTGKALLTSLGSNDRLEFAVLGPAVMGIARAEHLAPAGTIVMDDATRRALPLTGEVSPKPADEAGFWLLEPGLIATLNALWQGQQVSAHPPVLSEQPAEDMAQVLARLDFLSRYLPPALLARIAAGPERLRVEGEHRRVTILFANFYGIDEWIAAARESDLDELSAALEEHFSSAQQIIARYGGIINKVDSYAVGYRIMAIFGAPVAHEEDPSNAVRAALDLQQAVQARQQMRTHCGNFTLKQRVGINTGYVFAGSLGSGMRQEYSVIGDEVNLAARLMGVAQDGQTLISVATAQSAGGAFACTEMEAVRVKGKVQPVRNYAVSGVVSQPPGGARSGGETNIARLAYVGRQAELQQARAFLEVASEQDSPQILEIVGETGIGKTRFVAQLTQEYSAAASYFLRGQAASFGQLTPYLPWLPVLRQAFTSVDGLFPTLHSLGLSEWAPLVEAVLGLPLTAVGEDSPQDGRIAALLGGLDARMRQQRFFDIVQQVFQGAARAQPLTLVLEDMHWADAASLELLEYLVRSRDLPLGILVTRRPEDDFPRLAHLSLVFGGLDAEASADLALAELAFLERSAEKPVEKPAVVTLAPAFARLVYERSQGNPLYIEEITRSLYVSGALRLEQDEFAADNAGAWRLNAAALSGSGLLDSSTNLASLLMSRLDSLPEVSRRMLQVAAVAGQSFQVGLLAQIYPEGRSLDALTEQGLLLFSPPDNYSFKSALLQEVAYESLPFSRRREIHAQVGQALEKEDAAPAELARHFDEARVFERAFHYRCLAGERARTEYANQAALAHYRRALEILPALPALPGGVNIHEAIGDILFLTGDYEAAIAAYHAAALDSEGAQVLLANLLWKEARVYEKQGRYTEALACLERGIECLVAYTAPVNRIEYETDVASDALLLTLGRLLDFSGWVYSRLGNFERALQSCQASQDLLAKLPEEQTANELSSLYNSFGSIYMGQGSYAKAGESFEHSLRYGQQARNLPRQSMAANNLAAAAWSQGNLELAQEYLGRSLEISQMVGDLHSQAMLYNNLGVVAFSLEHHAEALQRYQRSLAVCRRLGDQPGAAQALTNIGEAYLALGELEAAKSSLLESAAGFSALSQADASLNIELPEVYRLLVEVNLQQDNLDMALHYASEALEIAQEAQNPEMSGVAARNLGRVHARLGRRAEAEDALRLSLEYLARAENPEETAATQDELDKITNG